MEFYNQFISGGKPLPEIGSTMRLINRDRQYQGVGVVVGHRPQKHEVRVRRLEVLKDGYGYTLDGVSYDEI